MRIRKVFNNNIVAAISDETEDIIVVGIGVGFQKSIGDIVEPDKVEKVYVFQNNQKQRYEQLIANVSPIYFEVTNKIIERASRLLHVEFNAGIFIAISDHIAFAIQRRKEDIPLPNIILNETKVIYKNEYKIGTWALKYIEKKIGVSLEEDEAGYIALHLVNFSINNQSNNATKIVTFNKNIMDIIRKTMRIELQEDALSYIRLSTHLKYLAEHIFRNENVEEYDTTSNLREVLKEDVRLALCINRIIKCIRNKYDYELTPNEQTYLSIHIKRNTE